MLHVHMNMLHVDMNKSHVNIIFLHVDIIHLVCSGQKYATRTNNIERIGLFKKQSNPFVWEVKYSTTYP